MSTTLKKMALGFVGLSLALTMLTGCSSADPSATVNSFFKAFKSGDYKTSMSYIEASNGSAYSKLDKTSQLNGYTTKELMNALATNYNYKNVKVLSKTGDTAKVQVTVASDDMKVIVNNLLTELMPVAMANNLGKSNTKTTQKPTAKNNLTQLTASTFMNDIKAKNAKLATRNVTLTLKKDRNGNYKIVGNQALVEALMANYSSVQTMFNSSSN